MAEISTDENSLPKPPTELEKDGLTFSSLFSLARACVWGDIAPLKENLHHEGGSLTVSLVPGSQITTLSDGRDDA